MNSAKEINTKNCTYYFFDDMINIENLDPDNIKIDEKSYKNIIYHIAHVTVKDLHCVNNDIVDSLQLIIDKING